MTIKNVKVCTKILLLICKNGGLVEHAHYATHNVRKQGPAL